MKLKKEDLGFAILPGLQENKLWTLKMTEEINHHFKLSNTHMFLIIQIYQVAHNRLAKSIHKVLVITRFQVQLRLIGTSKFFKDNKIALSHWGSAICNL